MKMKQTLILVPLLLLSITTPIFAEDQTLRETRQENRREIRESIKENREEMRELRTENRQEVRSVVAENHANRLERRFKFYYDRLSGIASRLQTRLDSLKSTGKDISSALSQLTEAKAKLESAKTLGTQSVAAFRAIDPAKFEEQKAEAKAARDLANQARLAFNDALLLFKGVLKEVK
ncbi:MAG: hypothetical protein Fur0011_0930 [Candidatus Microgenomates bacterium]